MQDRVPKTVFTGLFLLVHIIIYYVISYTCMIMYPVNINVTGNMDDSGILQNA